jgi:hypothetical protein
MSLVSSGCSIGGLLGAIAEGYWVGIPLADAVGTNPEAVVELGSTIIVDGIYGSVGSAVVIPGMLVTPDSLVVVVVVMGVLDSLVIVVGGSDVSGGVVLLPVGMVPLPEKPPDVVGAGGGVKADVVLVPVPGMSVDELGRPGVVVLSVDETVAFVTGGNTGSLMVVVSDTGGSVSDTGGSVTVAGPVVETPVPGPVIPSVGPRTEVVVVAFGDGSKTLEMAEPIPPMIELSGLPGSELLELVTIPVGAIRIPDVLVVGTGGSSDAVVSSASVVLLEDVGSSSRVLLVLLPGTGSSTVEEGRSGSVVEVSLDESSAGELVLPDAVSVEEVSSDELSVEEASSDELSVEVSSDELSLVEVVRAGPLDDEKLLDELSLAELLSDGSLVLRSDVLSLEDMLLDALPVVEDDSEVGLGKGGETMTVTGTTTVVTPESLDESDSELDCLLVVSNEVDGGTLSCDVVVALVTCRLTWRGK